ncbi:MAG: phosphoribosylamine--glycine ligase [Candidatus Dadabacteria bacterium]|nr:MAG: phosphoribosylamine--glycine ligase [Candidatus Dadabacteria bacterium]
MNILVIGSGGREHTLCWKLSKSPLLKKLYCLPGNGGTSTLAENIQCSPLDLGKVLSFAKENLIDLCIVGPEAPLAAGLSDVLRRGGIAVWGPSAKAAVLESSKGFAKKIMTKAGIPTAQYSFFERKEEAEKGLKEMRFSYPLVVKADSLAAGKGVVICESEESALEALNFVFNTLKSKGVVIEEFLEGKEVSYIVALHKNCVVPLASSHDYKRLEDNDRGPNTGGMGSVSPTPRLSSKAEEKINQRIVYPLLSTLAAEGIDYSGFLYLGLMINKDDDPYVLEFNVRLGDPETQAILPRFKGDLVEFLTAMLKNEGESFKDNRYWSEEKAVCVALASSGYPFSPKKGQVISGLEDINSEREDVLIFHGGTVWDDKEKVYKVSGGRVLYAVGVGREIQLAREKAYKACDSIEFEGKIFRRDIGLE